VNSYYGEECLKVNRRFQNYAGLFEPVRFAAYSGFDGFDRPLANIDYVEADRALRLEMKGGHNQLFRLGRDSEIGSEYIIGGEYE
jgi:hypothetical protein